MKIKILFISLIVLLLVSVYYNIKHDDIWYISFPNANTRPTYNTFHNIKEAQKIATGKGIKVGVIGKYFGYEDNKYLYAGGKDFTGNMESLNDIAEHGLWMATTLKEIAPGAEVFALCARENNKAKEARNICEAIDWAIENKIDILTYSAEAFSVENRTIIDEAVQKAINYNIVTTFIHYDLQDNILPYGFLPKLTEPYEREPDVNIFHFDYNLMLTFSYKNFLKLDRKVGNNIGAYPYFSNSSMSPVLAGIIAMMKEINNDLTPEEYKKVMIETSMQIEYNDYKVRHVVDANAAVNYLLEEEL
ncbi:peptidase [Lentimicrobium sp. S6]|uniref:peptidase n=1 Tax=Lentimicrobium sp. S6 TaxID=2735872 RepID=UPI001557285E|nr:peptidase [Lentimicrobium sp. S6]NPD44669.1 peptidase [Lentimicrobium sp. S6]